MASYLPEAAAIQTVPNRSRRCEACGTSYAPYVRRRDAQRFCSDECRVWAYKHPGESRQRLLDFTPEPQPVPPVVDQRVSRRDVARLRGHNLRIYNRLKTGPATNVELAALLGPAAAWRTRVSDVRRYMEKHEGLTITARELERGVWEYAIAPVEAAA